MKTAVVILNWNGKKFLQQFLPGVLKNSDTHARVIVADNCSEDGSVEYLRSHFPDVPVIQNEINGGFAKGYNDALRSVEAEYYVLLNSDIEVTPGWIEPVIEMMDKDPLIAACQPKLLSWHNRDEFEYAGGAGGFIDKYGYPFCRGRLFQSLEKDTGQYDDACEVFWATGACMFVRASVYKELGGLDERFFAHMEEIDFCWRAKNAGYRIMYCPGSTVYHIGAGTLPRKSWRKTYYNMRNNNIMLFKNLTPDRIFRVFAARIFLDIVAAIKFLIDGGIRNFFAVLRAHWKFFRMAPQLRKERKERTIHPVSKIYNKNLVVEYFLKRKKRFSDLNPGKFSR